MKPIRSKAEYDFLKKNKPTIFKKVQAEIPVTYENLPDRLTPPSKRNHVWIRTNEKAETVKRFYLD